MQTELNYDTVFDAQHHFRLLLDSMSRPGKINKLESGEIFPPEGLNQASALTGFALLNPDVTCFAAGPNGDDAVLYFLVNTSSPRAEIEDADYIFLPENYYSTDLAAARIGTPKYPEDSTTIIAEASAVSTEPIEGALRLTLKGPGVNGEAEAFVIGIDERLLVFLKEQNSEYPLGLDLIITDRQSQVLCIPRTNKFSFTQS
ncbi:MAG TPA: phosphonate C-P lyase system protein PhnH [Mucilaginibacter sp.]|nr:phosphonate C-P lyase system protein PhnH [Mucilaginibacter sp.]